MNGDDVEHVKDWLKSGARGFSPMNRIVRICDEVDRLRAELEAANAKHQQQLDLQWEAAKAVESERDDLAVRLSEHRELVAECNTALIRMQVERDEARRLLDEARNELARYREWHDTVVSSPEHARIQFGGVKPLIIRPQPIAAPVPAQPASIGLDVAAGIDGADYVCPRLRAEPRHVDALERVADVQEAHAKLHAHSAVSEKMMADVAAIRELRGRLRSQPAVPDDVTKDADGWLFRFNNKVTHFTTDRKEAEATLAYLDVDETCTRFVILSATDAEVKK